MAEETKVEEKETKPSTEEELKAVNEVKGRLEFFFSDANVRQDRFIRRLLMDKEGDTKGRVPIEALLRFNTIKKYTEKAEVVAKAAKELPELLTLNDEETAIGRTVEFTAEMMDDNIPKSLYVKNLPLTENDDNYKRYAVTVDQIRDLFTKYGKVALVKTMWFGKSKRKQPSGCAMVEFDEKESLEKAAAETLTLKDGEKVDATEKLEIGEGKAELEVMLLAEHIAERKKKAEKREREDDKAEKEIPAYTLDWKHGCFINLMGLPEMCNREAILDAIALALDISVTEVKHRKIYADFSRGQTEGAIRFLEPADHVADVANRLKKGELQICGEKVEDAFMLEGDAEKQYYEDFIEFKNKQIRNNEENKRARKKFKHGGRHRRH